MVDVMILNTLSGHLEIIRRHPPLAVELARRFTDAPLPAQADATAEMIHVNMSVSVGGGDAKAVEVAVYGTRRPNAADRDGALAVTILDDKGTCRIWYRQGDGNRTICPVALGPDSGQELAGGSPWLTVFAAALGAVDLLTEAERKRVLTAIDATGCGVAGIRALATEVMRKAARRARERLESDMATGPLAGGIFERYVDTAHAEGYALGLAEGRTEASIVQVLAVRGIPLTADQAARLSCCQDLALLRRWLGRALTAATAAEVLEG
jgi:hypothetical protein